MSQEEFLRDVFKAWEMTNRRSLVVPGEVTTVELPEEVEPDPEDILRAQKMAGSLIWLSTRTRPDVMYAQSRISSMATKAPQRAVVEGLRVLRYLQGTKSVGLKFKACENDGAIVAYTDANFGVKRSQTGSVIRFGR